MFVSNDLTKGFQTKSAVKKCYLRRKKKIFSSTREIQKKTEEKLSASLVLDFSYENLLIYHLNEQDHLLSVQLYLCFNLFKSTVCFHFQKGS